MKQRHIALLALLALSLCAAGCSSAAVELLPTADQEFLVRDGMPTLVSKKQHMVMLRPNYRKIDGNGRPAFTVVVLNRGANPETLLEKNLTASQMIKGTRYTLRIHRFDELVSEEQAEQKRRVIVAALSGAARAMSAANAGYVQTTGQVNAYGSYGSAYGTYSSTTYDPMRAQLAQQVAQAQTQSEFSSLQQVGEQNLQMLEGTILKDHTVMPGEWYGGTIVLDPLHSASSNGKSYFDISIIYGGEQHTFSVAHVDA